MSFLTPFTALIAAAVAVPALVALYFLKLKRRSVKVPTTLLWQRAVHDVQVNTPFQKLKSSWLLWLQLLLLTLVLVVMARPAVQSEARPGQRVILVIDHSASMNARDAGGQTRLEAAKQTAEDILDTLEGTWDAASADSERQGVMVIAVAHRAMTVQGFTGDVGQARAAVRAIEPTDQASQFDAALGLIEPHTRGGGEGQAALAPVVHVLSDGRFQPDAEPVTLGPAEVRYLRVGGGTDPLPGATVDNVGITRVSTRRDPERPGRVQVLVQLVNSGGQPVDTNLTLTLDEEPISGGIQRITVPAASARTDDATEAAVGSLGTAQVQYDFALTGSALLTVRHDHRDLLAADDAVSAVLAPARRLRVLMVGQGNAYLTAALEAADVETLVTMAPERYEQQEPGTLARGGWDAAEPSDAVDGLTEDVGFDVVVFDAYSPTRMPEVPSITLGGALPVEGLAVKPSPQGAPGAEYLLNWRRDHPLLRNVELADVVLRRPGRLALPGDAGVGDGDGRAGARGADPRRHTSPRGQF